MNLISAIILAVILVLLFLAARYSIRHKGCTECGGNCTLSGASCSRKNRYSSEEGDTRINYHVYQKIRHDK